MLESFLIKLQARRTGVFEIFNNTFFYRTAPMAASEEVSGFFCLIFSLAVFPFL